MSKKVSFIVDEQWKKTVFEKWLIDEKVKWAGDNYAVRKGDITKRTIDTIDIGYIAIKGISMSGDKYGRDLSDFVFEIKDEGCIQSYLNQSTYIQINQKEFKEIMHLINTYHSDDIGSYLERK